MSSCFFFAFGVHRLAIKEIKPEISKLSICAVQLKNSASGILELKSQSSVFKILLKMRSMLCGPSDSTVWHIQCFLFFYCQWCHCDVCVMALSPRSASYGHLGKLEALSKLLHHSHKKPSIVCAGQTDFSKRCWRFKSCPVRPWASCMPLEPRLVPSPLGVSLSVSRLSLSTQRCLDWGCRYSLAAKSCWHVGNPWVKRLSVFRL